jgi:hypothetical protein
MKKEHRLMLTDAIMLAQTEHVVYFLLAAYVETLDYGDPSRSAIPAPAKRLPLKGKADVCERLRMLRNSCKAHAQSGSRAASVMKEAVHVFSAALARLRTFPADRRSYID